jgi:predicted ArsR family transcriptional regulator
LEKLSSTGLLSASEALNMFGRPLEVWRIEKIDWRKGRDNYADCPCGMLQAAMAELYSLALR